MRAEKAKKKLSLKWRVFIYLAVFTGVIILLLWLTQSVFLERIYKSVKIREIESAAAKLADNVDSDELGEIIEEQASDNTCVLIVEFTGGRIIADYSYHINDSCVIHSIDAQSIRDLAAGARENGGGKLDRFYYNSANRKYLGAAGSFFEEADEDDASDLPEGIIYSKLCTNAEGSETLILLNTTITPVGATVETLNSMLIALTVILVLFALIMAALISRRISRPITRLTASAHELAKGNYDVKFDGGSYREVSELSDALNYAEDELAKTDGLRRELIANVSHDLRTPLTMMIGYGEMMRDIPNENTPENAQVIIDESRRLSSLVNDLLDISKLESGVGTNKAQPFDMSGAVEATLGRFTKLCEKDGYVIEFYSDGEARVNADEKHVMQAVYNLVANAVTHTGADKRVRVDQQKRGDSVRVSVTDTGDGIPADKLPLIWDRYYKVDSVHKRASQGSGLGLSIVKTVMEQNGGSYGVESAEGTGSTFWIELPLL